MFFINMYVHVQLQLFLSMSMYVCTGAQLEMFGSSANGFESGGPGVGQDHVRTIIAESAFPVAYIWSLIEFWRV